MNKSKIEIRAHKNNKKEAIKGLIGWMFIIVIVGVLVWKLI